MADKIKLTSQETNWYGVHVHIKRSHEELEMAIEYFHNPLRKSTHKSLFLIISSIKDQLTQLNNIIAEENK